ncbi:MAG: prepilin-type N-terminal cleavage/methylation domain-containing protein [Opitutus sp.]|nr:prepilin-type N-terminal cleavage/methylation domain-containing protein [Opitutus sp.]
MCNHLQFRQSRSGFTLLELLVATAVNAVVLAVIQTTFFGALRLNNTTHERIEEERVVQRTLGIVRRDFAGLMLPGGTLSGEMQTMNSSALTTGNYGERVSPDLFTNSGKIDGWTQFSEVQMVGYYLAPAASGAAGKDLVRVVTRNLLPVQEARAEDVVLLHGVAAASVLFYDGTGWTDAWDSAATSTLPSALKFSLVMAPKGGGQSNPAPIELVVPIVATTTTSQAQAAEDAAP